jgi:hypothetical protein
VENKQNEINYEELKKLQEAVKKTHGDYSFTATDKASVGEIMAFLEKQELPENIDGTVFELEAGGHCIRVSLKDETDYGYGIVLDYEIRKSDWKPYDLGDNVGSFNINVPDVELEMFRLLNDYKIAQLDEFLKEKPTEKLPTVDLHKLETLMLENGFSEKETQAVWHTLWDYSGDWLNVVDESVTKSKVKTMEEEIEEIVVQEVENDMKLERLKSDLGDKYEFIEHKHEGIEYTPVSVDKLKSMLKDGTTQGQITEPHGFESKEHGELDGKALWTLQAGDMRIDLRIWQYDLLEEGHFGNKIDFHIYSDVFTKVNDKPFDMELDGTHYMYSDLDIDKVNSIADIEKQMLGILDKVVQQYGLNYVEKPPTQKELYEQAVADDRFYLKDSGFIEQIYYNPDGNEEKGQYVSDNYHYTEILKAAEQSGGSAEKFFEYFCEISRQYLIDNDGGEDFKAVDEYFYGTEHDLVGCTDETMKSLIDYAHVQKRFEIYMSCRDGEDIAFNEFEPIDRIKNLVSGKELTYNHDPIMFADLTIGNYSIEAEYFPEFGDVNCSLQTKINGDWQRDDFMQESIDINASSIERELFRVLDDYIKSNGHEYGVSKLDTQNKETSNLENQEQTAEKSVAKPRKGTLKHLIDKELGEHGHICVYNKYGGFLCEGKPQDLRKDDFWVLMNEQESRVSKSYLGTSEKGKRAIVIHLSNFPLNDRKKTQNLSNRLADKKQEAAKRNANREKPDKSTKNKNKGEEL